MPLSVSFSTVDQSMISELLLAAIPLGPPRSPPQSPRLSGVRQGGLPLVPTFITYFREGGLVKKMPFVLYRPGATGNPISEVPSHKKVLGPAATGSALASVRTMTPFVSSNARLA